MPMVKVARRSPVLGIFEEMQGLRGIESKTLQLMPQLVDGHRKSSGKLQQVALGTVDKGLGYN